MIQPKSYKAVKLSKNEKIIIFDSQWLFKILNQLAIVVRRQKITAQNIRKKNMASTSTDGAYLKDQLSIARSEIQNLR